MSISSERLRELTETKIGEGQSRYVFGRPWKQLYKVLSEEERNLTEEMFLEGLKKCEFKDPERIGLISFLCPPLCTSIIDRVMGSMVKELYKFTLYVWYFLLIVTIAQSLIKWEMTEPIPLMILCMVVTSWSFRGWSREWNTHELIYHTLKAERKI